MLDHVTKYVNTAKKRINILDMNSLLKAHFDAPGDFCYHRRITVELCQMYFFFCQSLSLLLSYSVYGESGIKKDCIAVGSI